MSPPCPCCRVRASVCGAACNARRQQRKQKTSEKAVSRLVGYSLLKERARAEGKRGRRTCLNAVRLLKMDSGGEEGGKEGGGGGGVYASALERFLSMGILRKDDCIRESSESVLEN
jgi:hypothetical protein